MATLSNILNLVQCGLNSVLGTGMKGCRPFLKKVSTIWFLPQGFALDKSRVLDAEYVKELQQSGDLIVLRGIRTFTDNTPDDTFDELEDGTKQVARLGLYEFLLNFINGLYFHAALHSLSGYGNFDVIFWDADGNGLGTRSSGGSIKGFTCGYVQGAKLQWGTDSTAQREGLAFQLLERSELDQDFVFIQRNNLDFNPNRIDGINEVYLEYPSIPAAGSSLTVRATSRQDGKPFTGLSGSDFNVKVNGATVTATATDSDGTGVYTLSGVTIETNDSISVQLYDTENNQAVVAIGDDLYKSNSANTVAV